MPKRDRDLERALLAQRHQLDEAGARLGELEHLADQAEETESDVAGTLSDLDSQMEGIAADLGIDRDGLDLTSVEYSASPSEADASAIDLRLPQLAPLDSIDWADGGDYSTQVEIYLERHQLDLTTDPLRQLLSSSRIAEIEARYNRKFGNLSWNKWDYGVVALAAVLAILVDCFLVAIPKESKVTSWLMKASKEKLHPQALKLNDSMAKWLNESEWLRTALDIQTKQSGKTLAQVPYDLSVRKGVAKGVHGIRPKTHRLMTFGHDPILGFLAGTLDIMRGKMTVVDDRSKLHVLERALKPDGSPGLPTVDNFGLAMIKQFAHLLSDVFTDCGLAPPFLSTLQLKQGKSPIPIPGSADEHFTWPHLARYLYANGLNLQHCITQSLVPLVVEILIRGYYFFANFDHLVANPDRRTSRDVKLTTMLALGHSLAMSGNVISVWMSGWNPLRFNWSEMLMLVRSYYAYVRARQERDRAIEGELIAGWEAIYLRSRNQWPDTPPL